MPTGKKFPDNSSLPPPMSPKLSKRISWMLRIVAAVILGQTLFFKFTAAPESVFIFSTLGAEPHGRLLVAAAEVEAVILLLAPGTALLGGLAGLGIISGALMAHLTTKLGIVVLDDGGTLFFLALAVWICCAGVVWLRRGEVMTWIQRIRGMAARPR